jgi:uncharacterized protein (DUF2132 family)
MSDEQPNNPLHGITLQAILEDLVSRRGFEDLGQQIPIRCFTHEPSLRSSLKFLRKTEWARAKVEALYLKDQRALQKKRARNRARAERRRVAAQSEGDDE